jgi:signal transduction histidine kinase
MALDLLNESQPVATRDRLKLRIMTSHVLLERVAALMRPMAEDARVRLIVVPGADSTRLAIDYERMLRVFSNLIGNAIKFSAAGASVVVSADAMTGGVRFSVSDRGPGVAPEHLLRVFDRHWQATQHPQRGGFGLGLPIAKRLVEAHGGVIGVTSAPAGGATFHFTLPAAPAE